MVKLLRCKNWKWAIPYNRLCVYGTVFRKKFFKTSAASAVVRFAGVIDDAIFLPLALSCTAIKNTWSGTNSSARAREEWWDMDLFQLAKFVKMEADVRAAQVELNPAGIMVDGNRGTRIPNPLISFIEIWELRKIAVIQSRSMNQAAYYTHTINGTAKVDSKAWVALMILVWSG